MAVSYQSEHRTEKQTQAPKPFLPNASIVLCFTVSRLCLPPTMSTEAGPSTPNSRKRSKWDTVAEDDDIDISRETTVIKKRAKVKNIRTHDTQPSSSAPQQPSTSHSKGPSAYSKHVPPRTAHPPLLPSRSVYCYERLNQIEEGSYGVVFRARDKQTGDIVALKKLKLDEEKYGFPITSLREINALITCKHENVVGIREIVVGETLTQCVRRRIVPNLSKRASHRVAYSYKTPGQGIHRHGLYRA